MLDSPEAWAALTQLALALVSFVLTVATPVVSTYAVKWFSVKIEEKHMKALHEAAMTYAESAMKDGIPAANAHLVEGFRRYAERSVPDALRALHPGAEVLGAILKRYLRLASGSAL